MTLEALRTEYRAVRIGPAIVEEVRHVVHTVIRSRNYDPQVYAGAPDWDSAEEDVVQGVISGPGKVTVSAAALHLAAAAPLAKP